LCKLGSKKIAVVGVGNLLMGDEGIGIEVVKRLEELPKGGPTSVGYDVIDAGTAFFDIVSELRGYDKLIIVDAVHGGEPPGTVYRFTFEDIQGMKGCAISLHDFGVVESIQLERVVARVPEEIVFYGIEPERVQLSMELSPLIREKVEYVVRKILEELRESGISILGEHSG
jgi:hydrogenase maturation protease